MTNAQLKRKAKQIAVLVEMGIVSINEVKRKVKPQFYQDYVLPLLEERYIPLTYLRIYGGIGELIKADIASALVDIENYSAMKGNDFKLLNDLRNLLKGTMTTADQLHQEMFEKYTKAQKKIKYYSKAYPVAVKILSLSINEKLKTFSKFVPEKPTPSGATKLYNLIMGVKL